MKIEKIALAFLCFIFLQGALFTAFAIGQGTWDIGKWTNEHGGRDGYAIVFFMLCVLFTLACAFIITEKKE